MKKQCPIKFEDAKEDVCNGEATAGDIMQMDLTIMEKSALLVSLALSCFLTIPETVEDCNGEESMPTHDACLLEELKGFRSDMASSQSAIESAINTQGQAITNAVNTATSTIESAIEKQTEDIQSSIAEQTESIKESLTLIQEQIKIEGDETQALIEQTNTTLTTMQSSLESIDENTANTVEELKEANETLNSQLTELQTQTGILLNLEGLLGDISAKLDALASLADILLELEGISALLGDLVTSVESGNITLGEISNALDAILAKLNEGIDVNVDFTPVIDSITALQASMETLLTAISGLLANIEGNIDESNTKLDELISLITAGNITLGGISLALADILSQITAINANTDEVEGLLVDILSAVQAITDLDDTDDDYRPVSPVCVSDALGNELYGYFKVDEVGDNPEFVEIADYSPCEKSSPTLALKEECVNIFEDDGAGNIVPVTKVATAIYKVTEEETVLLRIEDSRGAALTEGTGAGEYQLADVGECDCETQVL